MKFNSFFAAFVGMPAHKHATLQEFLPHLNIIMVSSRVLRFRVIVVASIVLGLDPDSGLNSGWDLTA